MSAIGREGRAAVRGASQGEGAMAIDEARLAAARNRVTQASVWLRETQSGDGAWRIAPEARAIDNGLALLLCPEAFRAADAARMRVGLTTRQRRGDAPAAVEAEGFVVERVHRGVCDPAPTLDLSLPGWRDDAGGDHLLYFAALGHGLRWTMRGAPPQEAVRGRVHDMFAQSDGGARVVWASLAMLNGARDARCARALYAAQRADGSFGAQPLVTCLAAAALRRLPDARGDALRDALRWLDARGHNDAGLRTAHADVGDTALAARALDELRACGPVHLRAQAYLHRACNDDGGVPQRAGERSDVDATALATAVFDGSPVSDRMAHLLRHTRGDDGRWRRGTHSAPALDRTALSLAALDRAPHRRTPAERALDADTRAWLSRTWSDPSTLRALRYASEPWMVLTLVDALGAAHPAAREACAWLLGRQRSDGSWGSSPAHGGTAAATGAALAALAGFVPRGDARTDAAVDWLVEASPDDGRFAGPCDAYGPRPFLVDHPVRTHTLALWGLARWLRDDGPTATARGPLRSAPHR